jgi:phenylacetate-coenzyme A ligase PaaK-like adenylate-forming protein
MWTGADNTKHAKKINHTNKLGILCQSAATWNMYKEYLKKSGYYDDHTNLKILFMGSEPTQERSYIDTLDFEIKEQVAQTLTK